MDSEDTRSYRVMIHHEKPYSIWPADRELPLGWNDAGLSDNKAAYRDNINDI